MLKYEKLSSETENKILSEKTDTLSKYACPDSAAIRRDMNKDKTSVLRPPFIRDADKILHCPYFNRYADKTQVFSLYKNDDLTRRSLHVQLVSRIARNMGRVLNLNLDLIEAIALGHDIGHPPFAHTGEKYLDELLFKNAGIHFNHNIQSVRVLDQVFPYNITLQTLDGIACHNGELELDEYRPEPLASFDELCAKLQGCYQNSSNIKKLVPSTLEGCIVRISDIIAYLGKDRQDAERAHLLDSDKYEDSTIGILNAEIINNLITNIVENSYGKPFIKMDKDHFEALKKAKADNYKMIYLCDANVQNNDKTLKPMMADLYGTLLDDIKSGNKNSPIFSQHIDYINKAHYERMVPYENTEPNLIVSDYIASMTDDYFIDLHHYLFPGSEYEIEYTGYFN